MATNKKLTKFKSATTIVTADYANSIFGGLYGSSEADSLRADDPRVIGHVHDGGNADGHARKIDLVDHVDNQLLNQNLANNAVTKRNVRETEFLSEAIPESEEIDGTTYYYLDLRDLRGELVFVEDDSSNLVKQRSQAFDGTSYVDIAGVWNTATGRDFVFGSSSLDDLASGVDGQSRFFFDKSKSAFRAGRATSTYWNDSYRGNFSTAFGVNTMASGVASFATGDGCVASGNRSLAAGLALVVSGTSSSAFGEGSAVTGDYSFSSGYSNSILISAEEYESTESVKYASTMGRSAHSYAYGQASQASGTFLRSQTPLDTYSLAYPPGPADWSLYLPGAGGAQTFVMTMFGNFQINSASIDTANTVHKVIAQLDNFQDTVPDRKFRPRKNASYSIKTLGTISFSKAPNGGNPSFRHSVSFIAHSGITVQHDGSMFYSTDTLEIIYDSLSVSGGTALDLVLPGAAASTDDFRLYFTHNTVAPTNRSAGLLAAPGVMPPGHGFSFVLENRTFLNNATPGTTTSQEALYGEAICVRMEVTELNINLAKGT